MHNIAMHHLNNTAGTLTLIGSGEMTPGMARAHRFVMGRIAGQPRPAFLDTPAGFELNHEAINQKALEYFREQFDLPLSVAVFPSISAATPLQMAEAMRVLRGANYIFAGPGSPTYAARNLRNTPVFETIAARLGAGAHVVFASAAVLALSRYTIPVYEIYKVGEDPRWTDGLDLLGRFGFDLALVPHWNNASGAGHDTTRCFIGQPRFEQLRRMLPASTVILGVDEYTACVMDFRARSCAVFGAGNVTIIRADGERVFAPGDVIPFELLAQPGATLEHTHFAGEKSYAAFRRALDDERNAAQALGQLQGLMAQPAPTEAAEAQQTALMIREMTASLAVWLEDNAAPPAADPSAQIAPFVETLLALRKQLRAAKQYALADAVRDDLARMNIIVEDGPAGSTWKRA